MYLCTNGTSTKIFVLSNLVMFFWTKIVLIKSLESGKQSDERLPPAPTWMTWIPGSLDLKLVDQMHRSSSCPTLLSGEIT